MITHNELIFHRHDTSRHYTFAQPLNHDTACEHAAVVVNQTGNEGKFERTRSETITTDI